jgi:HD-like signal output (HDOD) protein
MREVPPSAAPAAITVQPSQSRGAEAAGPIEALLRGMQSGSDLPALASTIGAVDRAVAQERGAVSVLCGVILRDVALTHKLLYTVNAAHFHQFGGTISTVSRAIAILGQDQVRSLALSLPLLEDLQDKAQAAQLRYEAAAACFAGAVARELCARTSHLGGEEVFIAGTFGRLGHLLVAFHLPEAAQAVARATARTGGQERASREVLGMSYGEVGIAAARRWGLPEAIVRNMVPLPPERMTAASGVEDARRLLVEMANSLVDVAPEHDLQQRHKHVAEIAARFGKATGLNAAQVAATVADAARGMLRDAAAIRAATGASALFAALRCWAGETPP